MSPKVLFIILILIGCECVLQARALSENVTSDEKEQQEQEIEEILFGKETHIRECLNLTFNKPPMAKENDTNNDRPLWTVVILKKEVFQNKTFHIQQCAGSLIHRRVVLTAAHCLYNKSLDDISVRAGECDRTPDSNATFYQERQIESVVFQKKYSPAKPKLDIAMIFFKEPFNITRHVRTVCVPPPRPLDVSYTRCIAAGWERTSLGQANFKTQGFPIIPKENCENALRLTGLGKKFNLHKSFICGGRESEKDMLEGNGGAPLACPVCGAPGRMLQVGIMSWGFKNAPLPDVFTSISNSRHWIGEQLQQKGLKLHGCGIKWN